MRLGQGILEVMRALAVLALVLLNFAHAPLAAAAPADAEAFAAAADSFCGKAVPAPGEPTQAPCHACRIGAGADLPSPCGVADPAFGAVVVLPGASAAAPVVRIHLPRSAPPRGPPIA